MFIKDLQPRQTGVDVTGEIVEISQPREFSKFGKQGKVTTAFLKDQTGKVKLSLWNEQIEQVSVGDTVKVSKGYVNEFQGEIQLTTGKFGTLEVLDSANESVTEDNIEEAEMLEEIKKPHDNDIETDDEKLISDIENTSKKELGPDQEGLDIEEVDLS